MSTKASLIKDHKKMIEYEANRYSTMLPHAVVLSEAYKIAHKAVDTFDPKKGVKFGTHLTNQLKKLNRITTQYGNTVRLPENKQYKQNMLNKLKLELQEELGRPANVAELSEKSGLSIKEINHILQHRAGEITLSNTLHTPVFVDGKNDEWLHFVYHDLTDVDKLIFEHKTGFGGKKVMTNSELAGMLGISSSTVSHRADMIAEKVNENWLEGE